MAASRTMALHKSAERQVGFKFNRSTKASAAHRHIAPIPNWRSVHQWPLLRGPMVPLGAIGASTVFMGYWSLSTRRSLLKDNLAILIRDGPPTVPAKCGRMRAHGPAMRRSEGACALGSGRNRLAQDSQGGATRVVRSA
jgi:hypothetical protein